MRILKGVHQDGVLGSGELHKVKNQRRVELGFGGDQKHRPEICRWGQGDIIQLLLVGEQAEVAAYNSSRRLNQSLFFFVASSRFNETMYHVGHAS